MIELLEGGRGTVQAVLAWFFVLYPVATLPFFLALIVRPEAAPARAQEEPPPREAGAGAEIGEAAPGAPSPAEDPRPSPMPAAPLGARAAGSHLVAAATRVLANPRSKPWLRSAALRCLGRTGTDG